MLGIPDLLALDTCSYDYLPDKTSTKTVKDHIDDLMDASMTGYGHCSAYTVDYDGSAAALLTYKPKDSFNVRVGQSRLSKFRELLSWTRCVPRWGDDGHIHIMAPVTTGSTYDYEYSLAGPHTFFSKAYRNSLVLPNKVTVQTPIYTYGDSPEISESATDTESYALLPKEQFISCNLEDYTEAGVVASAILFRYQLSEQQGAATVPMNCGAEVYDYIKVTDSRENDSRTGNIGSLTRTFKPEKNIYNIEFGLGDPPRYKYTPPLSGDSTAGLKSTHAPLLMVPGVLSEGEDLCPYPMVLPFKMTIYVIQLNVKVPPTAKLIVDVKCDGETICAYDSEEEEYIYPEIAIGETAGFAATVAALPLNGDITVDILNGDGETLVVQIRGVAELWRPS
jgi:hypothetical protein